MKNDSKITITIEKENNLNEILDEILKLKEQEKEVNKMYENMIKKMENIMEKYIFYKQCRKI